jgi:hypothetical protein
MGRFANATKIGLRDRSSKEIFAVYPYAVQGSDQEIEKIVRDWYYQKNCAAEDQLFNADVDVLTEGEIEYFK